MVVVSCKRPGMCGFCGGSTLIEYISAGQMESLCIGCERFGHGRNTGSRIGDHPDQRRFLELIRRAAIRN